MDKEIDALLQPNKKIVNSLVHAAVVGSLIVMGIGLLCLLGWQFNIVLLKNFFPHIVAMNPLSAIGFITAGGALFFQLKNHNAITSWKYVIALILSITTALIGYITTLSFMSGVHVGLDLFFFTDKLAGNRMSPNTSISFLLIGSALIFFQFPLKKYFTRIAQILTLLAATISMFAVIGYAYQAFSFYKVLSFSPMPLSSALTFTIICLAFLFGTSNHGVTKILTKNTPSSTLALRLILITLTLPAVLGYLLLLGEQLYLLDNQTGISLLVIGTILIYSIVVWINTRVLQKLELENLIIKRELERENIKLGIDAKGLASKALELEEEKQEVYEKLSNREKLMELS